MYRHAPKAGPVGAVLTYPLTDYAGDYIEPGGGDWSAASQYSGVDGRCRVNWTHDIPVGLGSVALKSLAYKGQTHAVDYGETTFFSKAADLRGVDLTQREPRTYKPIGNYRTKDVLTAAEQVERLVRDDVATGVSIEFKAAGPKGVAWSELDTYSELERRPCLHYKAWTGLAYAHAIQPVNPGARTILTSAPEHLEKAIKVAVDGTLGGKPLCEVVYKAFSPLKQWAKPGNRITVPVSYKAKDASGHEHGSDGKFASSGSMGSASHKDRLEKKRAKGRGVIRTKTGYTEHGRDGVTHYNHEGRITGFEPHKDSHSKRFGPQVGSKAMEDESFDMPPGATVEMDEETPPVEDTAGPTPAVRTMLEGAQMLLDLADQLQSGIGQSEHKKARKYVGKIIAELQATADEMNAMAETVRADLEGDLAAADEEAAAEAEGDEPPMEDESELDDDIEEKAIVPIQRDADGFIVVKAFPNWKPRRFRAEELADATPKDEVDPAEAKAVLAELAREQRKARPYLRALRANRT